MLRSRKIWKVGVGYVPPTLQPCLHDWKSHKYL